MKTRPTAPVLGRLTVEDKTGYPLRREWRAESPLNWTHKLLLNCMDLRLDDGLATFIGCDKGTNR